MPINKFTEYIGIDKKLHALYGALGFIVGYIEYIKTNSWIEMLLFPIFLGFMKELWDWKVRKTKFCWNDFYFTVGLGYVIGILFVLIGWFYSLLILSI